MLKEVKALPNLSENQSPKNRFIRDCTKFNTNFKEKRSYSVFREKAYNDEKSELSGINLKPKSILQPSPLHFIREKLPQDNTLITNAKFSNLKRRMKKPRFYEKKFKLQIVNIIKEKLNSMI